MTNLQEPSRRQHHGPPGLSWRAQRDVAHHACFSLFLSAHHPSLCSQGGGEDAARCHYPAPGSGGHGLPTERFCEAGLTGGESILSCMGRLLPLITL